MTKIEKFSPGEIGKTAEDFISVPFDIYKNDERWIPTDREDLRKTLSEKNPFFDQAEAIFFVAYKDGKAVGRISASYDPELNEPEVGYFGYFECINDYEVAAQLFSSAKEWLKSFPVAKMYGPVDLSTKYRVGFLEKGFTEPPSIGFSYNPPYYFEMANKFGMNVKRRCFGYRGPLLQENVDKLKSSYDAVIEAGIEIRTADPKNIKGDLRKMIGLYNKQWHREKHFLYSPWWNDAAEEYVEEVAGLVDPQLFFFAMWKGREIGVLYALPNVAPYLIAKGRRAMGENPSLNPASFSPTDLKYSDGVKTIVLLALEKYHGKRIASGMNHCLLKNALQRGYTMINRGIIWEYIAASRKQSESSGAKENRSLALLEISVK